MNDEMMKMVEGQLEALKPAPLSAELMARIARQMDDRPLTWADRLVAGFMGLSAAAALFIVATIAWQMMQPEPPMPNAAEVQAREEMKRVFDSFERRLAANDISGWR